MKFADTRNNAVPTYCVSTDTLLEVSKSFDQTVKEWIQKIKQPTEIKKHYNKFPQPQIVTHSNSKKNVIEINTSQIKADLSIKLFGSKVKLATIDLSKYYKPSFEFSGPDFNQKIINIEKPNDENKQLQIGTKNHYLKIIRGKIIVTSDVVFTVLE